ncbi:MAG: ABC transporter ATP-binding protein [Verrucomicrobiales bacterium]|nr:ABC transporter ATP-binding protein [Verrucomicrobiales bacterium]
MLLLSLLNVTKSYGEIRVLRGLSIELEAGRTCVLLGASGSGKTTLARLICGLERPDGGLIEDKVAARRMLVAQDFVIWPHLTVRKNIALGYHGPKHEETDTIRLWLRRLGIEGWETERAGTLSFGQQQRVALARAMCFEPDLLVLDEPLAHLDAPARREQAIEIKDLCSRTGVTMLWITHDPREAFAVADEVAILEDGVIRQLDTPEMIYERPVTVGIGELGGEIA